MNKTTANFVAVGLLLSATFLGVPSARAGFHVWSGAVNGLWSVSNNWSSGGAPEILETPPVILEFPSGVARTSVTNNIYGGIFGPVEADSLVIDGDNYHLYGSDEGTNLALTGSSYLPNLYCLGTNITFDAGLNIILRNTNTITNNIGSTLHIQSVLTGDGGWAFQGLGTMYFDGSNMDTCTGTCAVEGGTVVLDRSYAAGGFFPSYAISGPLVIGTTNLSISALVSETAISGEFGGFDTNGNFYWPDVTIEPSGTFQISGACELAYENYAESIGALNMVGGVLSLAPLAQRGLDVGNPGTNYGALVINGPLTVYPSDTTSKITGHGLGWLDSYGGSVDTYDFQSAGLLLDSATNVINVMGDSVLLMDTPFNSYLALIDVVKTGSGILWTTGTNIYAGNTVIQEGTWVAQGNTPFGLSYNAADQVTVSNGAEILALSAFSNSVPVVLNGFGIASAGALVVAADGVLFSAGCTLGSETEINVESGDAITFDNFDNGFGEVPALAGSSTFLLQGGGTLTLSMSVAISYPYTNVFNGTCLVENGTLVLDGQSNYTMLNGPVTIGTNGSTVSTLVQLEAPQQIASNSPLTVADGGALDLGGYSQTVASLTLDGGGVEFGTLILKGNLTAQNGIDEPVFFIADLSLGGANRSLTVNAGSTFTIFGGIIDGGNNAGFTKAGTGELVLEGSGTYGGIASVNAGILLVEDGGALGGISASTVVAPGAEIDLTDQVFVDAEPLSIAGAGVDGLGALKGSGTNSWAGPITLTGSTVVEIASNGLTQFGGVLSGNSGSTLTMSGPGTLEYNGNSANTLAGSTSVSHGLLLLSKTNAIALPASLSVGASTYLGPNSEVRLLAPNQIGSAAQVTITDNGLLNLNNFSSPIGPLTLNGGIVETGSGLLTLNGNVAVDGTQTGNPIYGFVSLGGATRTFNCAPAGVCYIFACLSDGGNNAGLIVTGTGELFLGGSNSFNGTAVVSNGLLGVLNNYALGTINGGTVVTNGGTLYVAAGVNVGLEPLTLSGGGGTWAGALQSYGTNSWAGPVTLAAQTSIDVQAPGPLTLSGAISGPGGLQTIDAGILKLANTQPNTYAGPTIVNDGVLELAAVNGSAVPGPLTVNTYSSPNLFTNTVRWLGGNYQVSTNVTITLNTNTLMDLNNNTDAIGSLTGGGSLNLGTGSLIIGVNNTSNVFSGPITGQSSSSLVKSGSGTLTLAGNSAGLFTGLATVVTGQLLVTGSMPQATIDLDGGTLGGFGTVGPIGQAFYGGYVNPGGPGTLNSGTLTLTSKSTFMAALNGPPGGTNYSQINVTGGVSLGGAVLQLSVGIAGASNNQYILINNDGAGAGAVSGTFAGLAEGATLTANNGAHFAISYHGGAGKDVVLTQTSAPAPPKFSGIVKLAGGSIELSGSGATNVSYTVLASTNLSTTNWISIGTTGANGTGSFQFIDSNAPNFPHRFYILSGP